MRNMGRATGLFQPHRIGHQRPDVGMALQYQWHALNGRGVGALAAFRQPLLHQFLRIGQLRDLQASGAFAAEIIGHALAVRGLREHSCERVFTNARGPVNSSACGTREARNAPRNAATIFSLPRNSENPMPHAFFAGSSIGTTADMTSTAISSGSRRVLFCAS